MYLILVMFNYYISVFLRFKKSDVVLLMY